MNIFVRALEPQDWKLFKAIRLRALQNYPGVYLGSYKDAIERSEQDWKDLLDGSGKCIFGLFDEDRMVGLAAVFTSRDDPSGQLGVMAMDYLDPDYRGRHLSKLLYQIRIDWAKRHQLFRRLAISHREGNEPSRRANQAFGFMFIGKELIDWPDGEKALDYRYEIDLEALRRTEGVE